jgi:hypothetical protein
MCSQHSSLRFAFGKGGLLPQEEMLEIGKKQKKLIIGLPKEDDTIESRVPLTPEAIEILVNNGHEVIQVKVQITQTVIIVSAVASWLKKKGLYFRQM